MTQEIWGVRYDEKTELKQIQAELKKVKCKKICLEIPQDIIDQNIDWGFFGKLYQSLKKKRIKIIPLVSRDLANHFDALNILRQIYFKERTLENVRQNAQKDLDDLKNKDSLSKKQLIAANNRVKIFTILFKELKKEKTTEERKAEFDKTFQKLRNYGAKVIRKEKPDVSIVGARSLSFYKEKFPKFEFRNFTLRTQ